MKELMMLLGASISTERLVEELQNACNRWKENPIENNYIGICAIASLVLAKDVTNNNDLRDVIKQMQEHDRIFERMNSEKMHS